MARWNIDMEKEVARKIINSRQLAEAFIERYMKRNNASREKALERLREFGIELPDLPDQAN